MSAAEEWDRPFGSHVEFYQKVYDQHITGLKPAGHHGASLIKARQSAGDWSDASKPDLAIGFMVGRAAHLCRAFRESTGLPPYRRRMQRRIEQARKMLEGTDLPVTEIAASVGYDDPSELSSAFRKLLGVTPSQYRQERQW